MLDGSGKSMEVDLELGLFSQMLSKWQLVIFFALKCYFVKILTEPNLRDPHQECFFIVRFYKNHMCPTNQLVKYGSLVTLQVKWSD